MTIPYITEHTPNGDRTYDLASRLLEDRIVMLDCEVTPASAAIIIQELLLLNNKDNKKPIHLYIMSPGGEVSSGLGIVDTINFIDAPVYTYAIGMVASMGAALLSCGAKGHRYALPSTQIMCHRSSGGLEGNIQDAEIQMKKWRELDERLSNLIAANCGLEVEKYKQMCVRDCWLWAEDAVKFGIIDEILGRLPNTQPDEGKAKPAKKKS